MRDPLIPLPLLLLVGCGRALVAFGEAPSPTGGDDSGLAPDADHDGVPEGEDCDDTNPDVGAPQAEAWNGEDDDCDGVVDDLSVADVALGAIGGPAADTHLGDAGTLSLGGDLTGDAIPDVVLGSWSTGTGSVWMLDGTSVIGAAEPLSRFYTFRGYGYTASEPLGYVDGPMGDVTGDGVDDLLVVAVNPESERSAGYAFLLAGGKLEGSASVGDVSVDLFGGSEGDRLRHAQTADLDGDGIGDVVVAAPFDGYHVYGRGFSNGADETGNVSVFSGAWLEPYLWYQLEFAADQIHGSHAGDHLGTTLTTGDLDGDGYVDLLAGAPDARVEDEGDDHSGIVYVFPGNPNASWSGDRAHEAARVVIYTDEEVEHLGAVGLARPGDLDGDGRLDVVLADPGVSVRAWFGAGALLGEVAWSSANWILPLAGDCGQSLTADADLDADGRDELLLGCPLASTPGPEAGAVRVFSGGIPMAEIAGEAANDHFGTEISTGADLDRGGGEEVLVGAPGSDRDGTEAGAVYVLGMPEAG